MHAHLALLPSVAAPGSNGVQGIVPVAVGEGQRVHGLAVANGDALQQPRHHRDVTGDATVPAPWTELHH